ncbi:hypothetical protein ACOSQ3_026048 [Xanthoceras sorbifolium]
MSSEQRALSETLRNLKFLIAEHNLHTAVGMPCLVPVHAKVLLFKHAQAEQQAHHNHNKALTGNLIKRIIDFNTSLHVSLLD